MEVAVSLCSQTEYPSFDEQELGKYGDAKYDMDEDGSGDKPVGTPL